MSNSRKSNRPERTTLSGSKADKGVRPVRSPIGMYDLLASYSREGFKSRWVTENKVPFRLQQGYTFVSDPNAIAITMIDKNIDKTGSKVSIVGSRGTRQYLMECPEELAQERAEILEERNNFVMDQIKPKARRETKDTPAFYVPNDLD